MKIMLSIDALKAPLTGIGRYTYELAKGVQMNSVVSQINFYDGAQVFGELPLQSSDIYHSASTNIDQKISTTTNQSQSIKYHIKQILGRSKTVVAVHGKVQKNQQASRLKQYDDHIFHSPNFYLPERKGLNISTFHDLSIFKHPNFHPKARLNVLTPGILAAAERADFLITDSEFTRQEVIEFFNWPSDRISSCPLGVDDKFRPHDFDRLYAGLSGLGLKPGGYCLFVSTIEPRKNIEGLLAAFANLPNSVQESFPLVLVGGYGWQSDEIHKIISRLSSKGVVKYFGYLPEHLLPIIYAGAKAFFFPSWYEGFGLPVIEAMASGVPVVTSTKTSLPEVSGGAALLVNPEDHEALIVAMEKAIEDEVWRSSAIEHGLAVASQYKWQNTAAQVVEAYQNLWLMGKK